MAKQETTITTPSEREIEIVTIFDAPRKLLWKAYFDPKLLPEWWGPKGYTTIVDKHEFKKGGVWRYISKDSEGNEDAFNGKFVEINEPENLTWTFEWEPMPGSISRETVEFEELTDGKTKVKSTSLYFTKEERDGMLQSGMEKGVNEGYDKLAELLEKLKKE